MNRAPATLILLAALGTAGLGIAGQASAADAALVAKGQKTYEYWCVTCHGPGAGVMGKGSLAGTLALQTKYKGKQPAVLDQRTDLTPDLVKYVIRNGIQAMPYFRKTEVSDADMDAITAYLVRNNK